MPGSYRRERKRTFMPGVCTHAYIRLKLYGSCGEKYLGLESHSVGQ